MPKMRFSAEQIVTMLRQAEVAMGQGKSTQIACREAGISEQSIYRWRKDYGGLQVEQAKRMKDLEKENSRLKRLVASLAKAIAPRRITVNCVAPGGVDTPMLTAHSTDEISELAD